MKIKLGELQRISPILGKLLSQEPETKMAYWLGKVFKKVIGEGRELEESKNKLFEKFAEKEKDGTIKAGPADPRTGQRPIIWKSPEDGQRCREEITELLKMEIDPEIKPIRLSFFDKAHIRFSPIDVIDIFDFIEDDLNVDFYDDKKPSQNPNPAENLEKSTV